MRCLQSKHESRSMRGMGRAARQCFERMRIRLQTRKMVQLFLYILLGLLTLAYLAFRFGPALVGFEKTPEQARAYFQERGIPASMKAYEALGHEVHYVAVGADTLPTLLFIHGSPGSWDAYLKYLVDDALRERFRMISVDRLGYGGSEAGQPEPSLRTQAAVMQPLLEAVPAGVPVMLIGHSYGGAVAYRMAMDYPQRVQGLLILAGLADPAREKRLWIQRPLRSKWLRWLLPPMMDVSNREIVPLKGELKKMENAWGTIQAQTTIIQGKKDILVNYRHADFAVRKLQHLNPQYVSLPKANHFLPWSHYELVKSHILQLAERMPQE